MIILSIETSCDETAVSVVEATGTVEIPDFNVLGNTCYSQIKVHEKYGGVYPNLAKREHQKNLIPLFKKVLRGSNFLELRIKNKELGNQAEIDKILEREPELLKQFKEFIPTIEKPPIDAIAVTVGPGLEPALWVGVNFARALSRIWNIPIEPTNHMEGHIASVLLNRRDESGIKNNESRINYPTLALLISGGHTQLVLINKPLEYEILGETRDDAVGEAYDKVARMLGLPYPGGPEISRLASRARESGIKNQELRLPRPMINSNDYDFSFSGLKTAVLYLIKKIGKLDDRTREEIAREFDDAVAEVLLRKTERALRNYERNYERNYVVKTLIVAGGVASNPNIREKFGLLKEKYPELSVLFPSKELSTDNSIMIAMAAFLRISASKKLTVVLEAQGNLSFA
jgi:N6-L-threonylcarbamoyladenine synthase